MSLTDIIGALLGTIFVMIPIWLILSSPMIFGLWWILRKMRSRDTRISMYSVALLALISAILVTPVPYTMFGLFFPNILALPIGYEYYEHFWKWVVPAFIGTLLGSWVIGYRYLNAPNK